MPSSIDEQFTEILLRAYYRGLDKKGYTDFELRQDKRQITEAILACKPEPNPREWADNQPQMAWTIGFEKALDQWEQAIREALK